jgi:CheY-like chemotaxis protein
MNEGSTRTGASRKALKVLVVDDNEASAKTIGWMIEAMGFEAKIMTSGMHALEVAQTYRPDVILLDIGIPDINGYDVCRTLRHFPEFKDTLFIAQTGWGQDEHRQRSKEAGFDHHMVKPIDFKTLEDLLLNY